jgi:hypothetical protein
VFSLTAVLTSTAIAAEAATPTSSLERLASLVPA